MKSVLGISKVKDFPSALPLITTSSTMTLLSLRAEERVTVTGDGEYAEGTKAEIKVEAEDGFVIATVNGEAVEEAMKKIWTKTIESVTADVTFTITTTEDAAVVEPVTLTLVGDKFQCQ